MREESENMGIKSGELTNSHFLREKSQTRVTHSYQFLVIKDHIFSWYFLKIVFSWLSLQRRQSILRARVVHSFVYG